MRVLAIENYPATPLGAVGRALDVAGVATTTTRPHVGEPLPIDIGDYSGLVVLGGGQSAIDDDNHPFLPSICGLIRDFHTLGKPVLGICLGSQLIARAFGGRNLLGRPIEFGWQEVLPTETGRSDPVLSALGDGAPLFHWHNDTVELPDGAVHLASSAMTPIQAFRMGRTTYGIQFHFEAGLGEVKTWSETFCDLIARDVPDWPARMDVDAARFADRADATGAALATAWAGLL